MRLLVILVLAMPSLAVEIPVAGQDGRFNDEPTLARAGDGSVYVAWNGFRNGADALMVARYRYAGGEFRAQGSWEAVCRNGKFVYAQQPGDGARISPTWIRTLSRDIATTK